MSAKLLQTVWERFPLGGAQLLLLLALAEVSNDEGNCYVNIVQLGAAARLSRRSACRAVNQLRDERWLLTDRVLGQGGKLVYQLNTVKLNRSARVGHDEAAIEAQRVRPLGDTEAGLSDRIRPRVIECQSGTASGRVEKVAQEEECQSDTAPIWHSSPSDVPHDALEENALARQEQKNDRGAIQKLQERFLDATLGYAPEDENQGAEVPDDSQQRHHEAASDPFEADFDAYDDSEEIAEELRALRETTEAMAGSRPGFVPGARR